jgi:hypothetical protein
VQIGLVIHYSDRGSPYSTTFFNGTTSLVHNGGVGLSISGATALTPYLIALACCLGMIYVLKVRAIAQCGYVRHADAAEMNETRLFFQSQNVLHLFPALIRTCLPRRGPASVLSLLQQPLQQWLQQMMKAYLLQSQALPELVPATAKPRQSKAEPTSSA